jgi:hypothetical protein
MTYVELRWKENLQHVGGISPAARAGGGVALTDRERPRIGERD